MELGYVRHWDEASSPRIISVSFSFHGMLRLFIFWYFNSRYEINEVTYGCLGSFDRRPRLRF
jgi:hypothetical protein